MKFFLYQAYICVLTVIVLSLYVSTTRAQGLQIGDHVLDVELQRILNYTKSNARLKDFNKGKALLIDFWFTTCSSCIESFPKLDSIQKEFKNDLNVLLVTFETKEKVLKTFNTIKRISHVKLPTVVADTLMHLIFPHISAPHEIWISKDGKIEAITDHRDITKSNIKALTNGKELKLPVKKDNMEYSPFSSAVTMLELDKIFKSTVISAHQPGLPSFDGMYVHPDNGFLRVQATNTDFQSLYVMAYNQLGKSFNYNRFFIDSNVVKRLKLRKTVDERNTYCYESWWRDTLRSKACAEMQNELDHFFNLTSSLEKRKIPCIVLRQIGTQKRFITSMPGLREDVYYNNDTLFLDNVYLKYPAESILNYGKFAWSPLQFFDETGYDGKITIQLPKKFESIEQVNRFLKNFDLEVVIDDRWMDVILIKENTSFN